MTQTPTELLAPYKAPLVEAARALLRASGTDGIAFEIPASIPPCTIVVGATDQIGKLLRTPSREPMLGGRRAGDLPAPTLTFDEPETDGPLVVDSPDLVTIRRWLQAASEAGKPVTLSGLTAAALAAAEAPMLDAAEIMRLRRLVHALGMDGSTNMSDEQVRGLLFTALGQAAGRIERAAPTAAVQPSEQEWISVEDQLPAARQIVLVMSESWEFPAVLKYQVQPYQRFIDEVTGRWYWYPERMHWTPLPALPKAAATPEQSDTTKAETCTYPKCNCPIDAPSDPNWCARGLARPSEAKAGETKACWSCKRAYTAEQRANADGNCPHCGVEIELDDATPSTQQENTDG